MITAIVPTCRPAWETFPALHAIASQSRRPDRIVVIDDTRGDHYPYLSDERMAWFCLREEIRVVNSANLGIPAGTSGYGRLAVMRPEAARLLSPSGLVWFVDDDVVAEHDCLAHLETAMQGSGALCIAASIEELLPHFPSYWPRDSWGYNHHHRAGMKLVGATGLGCTLVNAHTFLFVTHRTVRPDLGLEDVIATMQIAARHGRVGVSGDARALHLRGTAAKWSEESLSLADLAQATEGILSTDEWAAILPLIGELK